MRPALALVAALAGALAITSGCAEDDDDLCWDPVDLEVTLTAPLDPPMLLRVEGCRLDPDACRDVCSLVLAREQIAAPLVSCDVAVAEAAVDVALTYRVDVQDDRCVVLDGFLDRDAP